MTLMSPTGRMLTTQVNREFDAAFIKQLLASGSTTRLIKPHSVDSRDLSPETVTLIGFVSKRWIHAL
jgi:hypothetical protein